MAPQDMSIAADAHLAKARDEASAATPLHYLAARSRRAAESSVRGLLAAREDKNCSPQEGINLCEKPANSGQGVTWIIVGVTVGVIVLSACSVLLFLHWRKTKRDKLEDMEDRFQMSDYGLDDVPVKKKSRQADEPRRSPAGSPGADPRRSREPLQDGQEPKPQAGRLNGHLNPFDDGVSVVSGDRSSYPASVAQQWPPRESSQGQQNRP